MYQKFVIAGNASEFKAWMRRMNAHPDAAVFVDSDRVLLAADADCSDIELVGDYEKSPFYNGWGHRNYEARKRQHTLAS